MRRFNFISLVTALFLVGTLTACAHITGHEKDAMARLLGRRIGLEGTKLYPGKFISLGITASQACPQRAKMALPAAQAFSLIVKTIQTQTDNVLLTQELNDVIEIMGIDLNKYLEVINLTPRVQGLIIQFVCSFAQGVDRAKRNP